MTVHELALLVARMRSAQREYFRTRTEWALSHSKNLERQVDRALREILEQSSLFDQESKHGDFR